MAGFLQSNSEEGKDVVEFQHKIVRLLCLLYASSLERVSTVDGPVLEIVELDDFDIFRVLQGLQNDRYGVFANRHTSLLHLFRCGPRNFYAAYANLHVPDAIVCSIRSYRNEKELDRCGHSPMQT